MQMRSRIFPFVYLDVPSKLLSSTCIYILSGVINFLTKGREVFKEFNVLILFIAVYSILGVFIKFNTDDCKRELCK